MANNLDIWYNELLKELIFFARKKSDRTGTGTYSTFGRFFEHNMEDGFPMLTGKKLSFKNIAHELFWFLSGNTNIKYLIDNGVNIWNGDAFKSYQKNYSLSSNPYSYKNNNPSEGPCDYDEWLKKMKTDEWFSSFHGNLGPIYGAGWRYIKKYKRGNYGQEHFFENIDQIETLITKLKTSPDDRRMLVSAWQVDKLDKMVLPPCHYAFQVYTEELTLEEREEIYVSKQYGTYSTVKTHEFFDKERVPKRSISLMWHQRSCDFFLGVPYNIASYGLLLSMLGHIVNMKPKWLKASLGDTHLYANHAGQAKEQVERKPRQLPMLLINKEKEYKSLTDFVFEDLILYEYDPHPAISAPLSN